MTAIEVLPPPAAPAFALAVPEQASSDAQLVAMWLFEQSIRTKRVYGPVIAEFRAFIPKPLRQLTLGDLQAYSQSLIGLAPATRSRKLSTVKSLLTFGHRLGYLAVNVGVAHRLPKLAVTLTERIMDERDVHRLLALERDPRNLALLTTLYGAGLRVSEACGLKVRNLTPRGEGGQLAVFGKGGKTRIILVSTATWRLLAPLVAGLPPDAAVFRSREGAGHLSPVQVHRIVKAAAKRAGLSPAISAHWLRHAHATYALARTKDTALVQATLGHASLSTTSRYVHARPDDSSALHLGV